MTRQAARARGASAIHQDLQTTSQRIGEQVRTVSLGCLALAWLLLAKSKDMPAFTTAPSTPLVLAVAGTALLALILDYAQSAIAYEVSRQALRRHERGDDDGGAYERRSFLYRARSWTFHAKQVAAVASAAMLVYALGHAALG